MRAAGRFSRIAEKFRFRVQDFTRSIGRRRVKGGDLPAFLQDRLSPSLGFRAGILLLLPLFCLRIPIATAYSASPVLIRCLVRILLL
jgi:hypothetical protein